MIPFRILPVTMAACSLFIFVKIAAIFDGAQRLETMIASPAYAEESEDATEEKAAEDKKPEDEPDGEAAPEETKDQDETGKDTTEDTEESGKKEETDGKEKEKEKEKEKQEPEDTRRGGLFDKCQFNQIEVDLLQSLAARREEIEKWADDVKMQEKVLKATEMQIDQKIAQMQTLQEQVQTLLTTYEAKEAVELKSLVRIYENMKPKDAARIFNEMEMGILLDLVDIMSERKASPILANMDPKRARDLTIELAEKRRLKQQATASADPEAAGETGN